MDDELEVERRARRDGRPGPVVRAATRLGPDDHGQPLIDPPQADPQRHLQIRLKGRQQRLRRAVGRRCGAPGEAQAEDAIFIGAADEQRLADAARQCLPLRDIDERQRPRQALTHPALGIQHLIAYALGIERALDAMKVLDALGHAMGRAGACGADLQHAAMDLHVEGEDVAAEIGQHAALDEHVPELGRMLGTDLALIGTREAVDGEHRVVAKNQLVAGIGMALQHVAEPRRLDMALAAQARPHRVDEDHQEVAAPHEVATGPPDRAARCAANGRASAKRRFAHRVVGRVVAGRVPEGDRLAVEPGHLMVQPVPPLRLELGTIGRQARDLVAQEGDELGRRIEAPHDGVDRGKGLRMKGAGNARARIAVDHELMALPARQRAGSRRTHWHRSWRGAPAALRSSFALPKARPSPDGILAICEARRNFSSPTVR